MKRAACAGVVVLVALWGYVLQYHTPGSIVLRCILGSMTLVNTITGFVGERGNSNEYNAILRMIHFLPFSKNGPEGARAVKDEKFASCKNATSFQNAFIRPTDQMDSKEGSRRFYAKNRDHVVPFELTRFRTKQKGSSELSELTLLYAHGGGMIAGCIEDHQVAADYDGIMWMHALKLSSVTVANVDYRLLPNTTMEDSIDDYLAVYRWLLRERSVHPSTIVFTGCSGGGSMALYSYMRLLLASAGGANDETLPEPRLVVAHSPGPGLEFSPSFPTSWEETPEWAMNTDDDERFFFGREAGRQWGLEWDDVSQRSIASWLANSKLIGRLDKNKVLVTSAEHEMFAAPHRAFLQDARSFGATLRFLSFPNRTHCLHTGAFSMV